MGAALKLQCIPARWTPVTPDAPSSRAPAACECSPLGCFDAEWARFVTSHTQAPRQASKALKLAAQAHQGVSQSKRGHTSQHSRPPCRCTAYYSTAERPACHQGGANKQVIQHTALSPGAKATLVAQAGLQAVLRRPGAFNPTPPPGAPKKPLQKEAQLNRGTGWAAATTTPPCKPSNTEDSLDLQRTHAACHTAVLPPTPALLVTSNKTAPACHTQPKIGAAGEKPADETHATAQNPEPTCEVFSQVPALQ